MYSFLITHETENAVCPDAEYTMQLVLHSVGAERHDLIIQTLLVANDDVSIPVSLFRIALI